MAGFVCSLRRWLSDSRRESGQMIIIFAMLLVPVSMALGIVAVDAAMWQSERRGAQKDADLAALAGAFELIDPDASSGDAESAAISNADENDEAGIASPAAVAVDSACGTSGVDDDAKHVEVELLHESRTFFATAFGFDIAPDIGGRACAKAGLVKTSTDFVPVDISKNGSCFTAHVPNYGDDCLIAEQDTDVLHFSTNGSQCGGSAAPTGDDLRDMIESGADAVCEAWIQDDACGVDPEVHCVETSPVNAFEDLLAGFEARLGGELPCDELGDENGFEEFAEAAEPVFVDTDPDSVYSAIDCDPDADGVQSSNRLIRVVVLGAGGQPRPVKAMAAMYVVGCEVEDAAGATTPEPDCDVAFDPSCTADCPRIRVLAQFVKLLVPGAELEEQWHETGTLYSTGLVE